jgi:kynurenine 3-monooxygenase
MTNNNKRIAIIGAGLVGSLMAIYLRKRGYNVTIYERRADMRKSEVAAGRSINLALSNRGWKPLAEVGLEDAISEMIIPMNGRMMHDAENNLTFQPYGKEGQAINSISRGGLNQLLIERAEDAGVSVHFDHKCLAVDHEKTTVSLEHDGQSIVVDADVIIGADGAYSAVRQAFQKTDRFNYNQHYIDHGYKELVIPAGAAGSFSIEKNALHIWPRGNYMLIALPNIDGSFTCTLFFPFEGKRSFSTLHTDEDVLSFFKEVFPDAVDLMPTLLKDYRENPTSSLLTIKCYPWVKNKTLIIGDASHAIVPFYGQGMNSGFEDCRVLNDMLNDHGDNWEAVLPLYQARRKPDADAILDLALQNFIEMRDLVADEYFLIRKKIEAKLNAAYPNEWIPLYSMVTFQEDIRYSEAIDRGRQQKAIMDEVMNRPAILEKWEELDLAEIIRRLP